MIVGNFNVDNEVDMAMKRLHDQIDGICTQRFVFRDRIISMTLISNQPLFGKGVHMEYQKSSNELTFVFKTKP